MGGGVDPKARRDFWEQIHELAGQGLTFLIATHYMDEAERCHRLAFIVNGNLLTQGTLLRLSIGPADAWSVSGPDLVNSPKIIIARCRTGCGFRQCAA
jgi:ABC-2 type transport system ATP-binding protein